MACSVRLHKGAALPPPRRHIHMHRRIFLANIRKPFANPAPELGVKPQAHGGPPSPGKKGKPQQAEKRYGRPLLVYCPRNPEECKLLLSAIFFKAQHNSGSQGSPLFPKYTATKLISSWEGRAREAQPHCPGKISLRHTYAGFQLEEAAALPLQYWKRETIQLQN